MSYQSILLFIAGDCALPRKKLNSPTTNWVYVLVKKKNWVYVTYLLCHSHVCTFLNCYNSQLELCIGELLYIAVKLFERDQNEHIS